MKDFNDPFLDLGMDFIRANPFPKVDPLGDERKRVNAIYNRQIEDALGAGATENLPRIMERLATEIEELDRQARELLFPWDMFRAAFSGYQYSHFPLTVILNRLRREMEIPLAHKGAEEEQNRGGLSYLESDFQAWLFTQVHQADLLAICLPFFLDPEGKTDIHGENVRRGFEKGMKERPRDLAGLNKILRERIPQVEALDRDTAAILSGASKWFSRVADLRNNVAHGWIHISITRSQWSKQWVANGFGWGRSDQVVDLEAFIARATFNQHKLFRDLSASLAKYALAKVAGFKSEQRKGQRADSTFYATADRWLEIGKERAASIALVIHEERFDEARATLEKLANEVVQLCSKGHRVAAQISADERKRAVLSLKCECGQLEIREELEAQFSHEFMEKSNELERPSTPPRWVYDRM